jgi:hypothetical protein
MSAPESLPVFVCNASGDFLALIGDQWEFTADYTRAHIFDYHADDIAAQLRQAWRNFGVNWTAHPVDPRLATEICDECHGTIFSSTDAHFDGSRFRCASCASRNHQHVLM